MEQRLVDEDLARVMEPVATANGLSNRYYTDRQCFEAEKERVFFDNWAAIGFAKDVPENGDAMPLTFLGQPLVVIRGRDGKLRVFQNICRHRGMILVREPGRIRGAIRCPYHSWCYDLDGALKATPHVGGPGHNTHAAIDRDALGLIEVRSHVWRDVVFVNISGDAPPFEEAHEKMLARWREFDRPLLHSGADSSFKLEVADQLETRRRELLRELPPALGASRPEQLFAPRGSLSYRGTGRVFRPGNAGLPPAARRRE